MSAKTSSRHACESHAGRRVAAVGADDTLASHIREQLALCHHAPRALSRGPASRGTGAGDIMLVDAESGLGAPIARGRC
eukprot:387787-Pyramimonas_sp.AAC.1